MGKRNVLPIEAWRTHIDRYRTLAGIGAEKFSPPACRSSRGRDPSLPSADARRSARHCRSFPPRRHRHCRCASPRRSRSCLGRSRSLWSQPTPKRRSASAFALAASSAIRSRRASNTTKSLPRPCIFRKAVIGAYIGGCRRPRQCDHEGAMCLPSARLPVAWKGDSGENPCAKSFSVWAFAGFTAAAFAAEVADKRSQLLADRYLGRQAARLGEGTERQKRKRVEVRSVLRRDARSAPEITRHQGPHSAGRDRSR